MSAAPKRRGVSASEHRSPPVSHPAAMLGDVMDVRVVRSAKRRKTVAARLVGDVLEVRLPAWCDAAEETKWVEHFRTRFERRREADADGLVRRAERLADRYGLPRPASIRWSDSQEWRWGSCTPSTRTIRISTRVAGFPDFVQDHVVLHELAHLVEPNHGLAFKAIVARYPLAERATGYLLAKGG